MVSNKQNQTSSTNWLFMEIWIDLGLYPPYVLQLIKTNAEQYQIIDPKASYTIIHSTSSYQEATFWLNEDEYEFIGNRIINRHESENN